MSVGTVSEVQTELERQDFRRKKKGLNMDENVYSRLLSWSNVCFAFLVCGRAGEAHVFTYACPRTSCTRPHVQRTKEVFTNTFIRP